MTCKDKVPVHLTSEQIDRIIKELVRQYGRDENEMVPLGEIRWFLKDRYLIEKID